MRGTLEQLTANTAAGWVTVPKSLLPEPGRIEVSLMLADTSVANGPAHLPRNDVSSVDVAGFSFALRLPSNFAAQVIRDGAHNLALRIGFKGEYTTVPVPRYFSLAFEINNLDRPYRMRMLDHFHDEAALDCTVRYAPKQERMATPAPKSSPVCVITYANDAGAWFPYFYAYYGKLFGPRALYVITPKPENFAAYQLGGVISAANLTFDDLARQQLAAQLASGLQAYYTWSLCCDVDEIVTPHPASGKTFLEILANEDGNILLTRGLDVLQTPEEANFDFNETVMAQRRYGVPSTSMCKPHLARVPIHYSGGHHYCQERLSFAPSGCGFLTLHLKWACHQVRAEVQGIVAKTSYADLLIAKYAARSVAIETRHPLISQAKPETAKLLASQEMQRFEAEYGEKLTYSQTRGLWLGEHRTANFVVDLRG